jgi:MFS family permease
MTPSAPAPAGKIRFGELKTVIGFLVVVELTSGVLQGFFTPLLTDIARMLEVPDADVNWLEGGLMAVSAIAIPAFAKLGDMVGHKRMLAISTALTAIAACGIFLTTNFWLFLLAWSFTGFYVVWLPLETALIYSRARRTGHAATLTRRAAGLLVAALETGVIISAVSSGALVAVLPLRVVLAMPAVACVICFFFIWFGIQESPDLTGGRFDWAGMGLVAAALLGLCGGLFLLRVNGVGSVLSWAVIALGVVLFVPFIRHELGQADPLIDIRMFTNPSLWPVFLTAGLFGVSVLGAQAPLSTFARTDPLVYGYGLGASAWDTSLLVGAYVMSMVVGALLLPIITRPLPPRIALIGACVLVATGYLLFLPFHTTWTELLTNMIIAGIGSGSLVAALPASAAAAAPVTQTGVATGLTNSVKTVGGAIASAVFGLALATHEAGSASATGTAGSFSGYVTVWIVCGLTALVAAISLLFVPKTAFSDQTAK